MKVDLKVFWYLVNPNPSREKLNYLSTSLRVKLGNLKGVLVFSESYAFLHRFILNFVVM